MSRYIVVVHPDPETRHLVKGMVQVFADGARSSPPRPPVSERGPGGEVTVILATVPSTALKGMSQSLAKGDEVLAIVGSAFRHQDALTSSLFIEKLQSFDGVQVRAVICSEEEQDRAAAEKDRQRFIRVDPQALGRELRLLIVEYLYRS